MHSLIEGGAIYLKELIILYYLIISWLQDDRPPFFEFTALKSRTVQIILLSTFLSHVGIFSPLFFLVRL